MNNIEKTVIDLIARLSGLDKKRITLNSTLHKDLGLLGDDAVELFQAFQKEFGAFKFQVRQRLNSLMFSEYL